MARPRVLHVVHTWGVGSHTFLRSTVCHTPAEATVLCRSTEGEQGGRRVVALGRLRGKAGVAAGVAVAAATRAEVVHAHFAHELRLARRVAGRRRPLVVSLHGHDLLVELASDPEGLAVVRDAAAVVVPSRFLADAALAVGVDEERVHVVPSGVELDELPPPRPVRRGGEVEVLFVGRFVEKKAPLDAVAAVAAAREAGAPLRLRLLGGGPLEVEVRAAAAALDGAAEVVDGSDRRVVAAAFGRADVLLSPSRTASDGDAETLLMVNVEAQAAGLPVVTTRHGGIPEGVAAGAGVLVNEGDVAALAAALVDLAADPDRRAEMGRAGRRWVEEHLTAERAGARTAELYGQLLGNR